MIVTIVTVGGKKESDNISIPTYKYVGKTLLTNISCTVRFRFLFYYTCRASCPGLASIQVLTSMP